MSRETIAFSVGLLLIFVGLGVWILRPNDATGKTKIVFLGIEFSLDTPALAVMVIGIVLMVLSPRFHVDDPKAVVKTVCTGEHEENCPGDHDMYFYCGTYPPDEELGKQVCHGVKSGVLRLKTVSGNKCGYSLLQITCPAP